jgi:hypothetical protein
MTLEDADAELLKATPPCWTLTYEALLDLARRYEGATLETVTGKRFRIGVYMDGPYFIPESSGRGQSDGRPPVRRFIERYNATHSLRPKDYQDVTRNASYLVGLLLRAQADGRVPRD